MNYALTVNANQEIFVMSDKNSRFIEIAARLRTALKLPSENKLASVLGMGQSTWSTRKTRNQLPKEAIDALILREGLSPDYIYDGTGSVYIEDDEGHTWQDGLKQRAAMSLGGHASEWLVSSAGIPKKRLALLEKKKDLPSLSELREVRRLLKIDLNWLITGEIIEAPSIVEEALLKLYRQAPADVQQEVLSRLVVANSLSNKRGSLCDFL